MARDFSQNSNRRLRIIGRPQSVRLVSVGLSYDLLVTKRQIRAYKQALQSARDGGAPTSVELVPRRAKNP